MLVSDRKYLDNAGNQHKIKVLKEFGRYTIKLDNEFYATAESAKDVREEVEDIIKLHHLKRGVRQ